MFPEREAEGSTPPRGSSACLANPGGEPVPFTLRLV
jgi:hypothetical protein